MNCDLTIDCPHHGDGDCDEDTVTGETLPPLRCDRCADLVTSHEQIDGQFIGKCRAYRCRCEAVFRPRRWHLLWG